MHQFPALALRIFITGAILFAALPTANSRAQTQRLTRDGQVFGNQGLITDPNLAAVTEAFLAGLARFPVTSGSSATIDLRPEELATYRGQVEWVRRSENGALQQFAAAYWKLHPGDPMPPLIAVVTHPRYYASPDTAALVHRYAKEHPGGPTTALRAMNPDRHEVDSTEAVKEFHSTWLQRPQGGNGFAIMQAFDKDQRHIAACGAAVKELRKPRTFRGFTGNAISNFDEICLFSGNKAEPPKLRSDENEQAGICLTLYTQYDVACFKPRYPATVAGRLYQALALIFVAKGSGTHVAEIKCTGLFIDRDLVITGRHCAEDFIKRNWPHIDHSPPLLMVQSTMGAYRDPTLAFAQGVPSGRVVREIRDLDNMSRATALASARVPPERDYILLMLSSQDNDDHPSFNDGKGRTDPWTFHVPEVDQFLVLPAISDFVLRAKLLKARLDNKRLATDFELIATQSWKSAVRVDESPVCALLTRERRVLRHYCQSFGGASGAPLIGMTAPIVVGNPQGLTVVGVHVGDVDGGVRNEKGNAGVELTDDAVIWATKVPRWQ